MLGRRVSSALTISKWVGLEASLHSGALHELKESLTARVRNGQRTAMANELSSHLAQHLHANQTCARDFVFLHWCSYPSIPAPNRGDLCRQELLDSRHLARGTARASSCLLFSRWCPMHHMKPSSRNGSDALCLIYCRCQCTHSCLSRLHRRKQALSNFSGDHGKLGIPVPHPSFSFLCDEHGGELQLGGYGDLP